MEYRSSWGSRSTVIDDALTPPYILLDDQGCDRHRRSLLFTAPLQIFACHDVAEVRPALRQLDLARTRGYWVAGWLAYEAAAAFEPRLTGIAGITAQEPLLWFGVFEPPGLLTRGDVGRLLAESGVLPRSTRSAAGTLTEPQTEVVTGTDHAAYTSAVDKIMAYIVSGDVYQVNETFDLKVHCDGPPLALYKRLRTVQPVEFGACIDTGEHCVLSFSPELFVERRGIKLITRPMKGTAPRGLTLKEDQATMQLLADDPKSRAENLMIVDLLRNDLSKIADLGSVTVQQLFQVERLRTILQMTSTVEATRKTQLTLDELFNGMFPCGSVTGAPKIRAMEIIHELESRPRGIYTGAIGYAAPHTEQGHGDFCFSVPIRTLVLDNRGAGRYGIGAGIVADSKANAEYRECLLKAKFLSEPTEPFDLVETMQWAAGKGFYLLNRHISRLRDSAEYFGFRFEDSAILAALEQVVKEGSTEKSRHAGSITPVTPLRIRLTLSSDGEVAATATSIPESGKCLCGSGGGSVDNTGECKQAILCPSPLRISDPFLYHKTTRRRAYDEALAAARHSRDVLDVLFVNERGELTEGSYTNLFVERESTLLTPPLTCGLLPGTLRAELLASGRAKEQVLKPDELLESDLIFLGNSVRRLHRVSII